jgi:hypothetical protein
VQGRASVVTAGVDGEAEVEHQRDGRGVAALGGVDHRRGLLRDGDATGQPGVGGQQPLDLGPVRVLAGGQQPVGAGDGDIGAVLATGRGAMWYSGPIKDG